MEDLEPGNDLINKIVTVSKTDGYQKRGTLLELSKDYAKLRFYDGTIIVIPTIQISQIRLNGGEHEHGRQ